MIGRAGIHRGFVVLLLLSCSLALLTTPVRAAGTLCGNGSAPDYGFTNSLQQAHWTVGWQGYVSQQTVDEVDTTLDQLNNDSIAQTMILILPQDQVGNRVNCAVHFLRYMKLGLPTGPRKDNGFVFLIVVESDRIDVHYGVGLGLPALTASELTDLNRVAEDAYQSTHSLDDALLRLVHGFDEVARNNYTPLASSTTSAPDSQEPAGPLDIFTICLQLCFGLVVLMVILWGARRGIYFGGFGGGGFGGGFGGRGGGFGGGFGGGRGGGSSMRGGGGSGRSGRGN